VKIELVLTLPCNHQLRIAEPLREWENIATYVAALKKGTEMHRCELVTDTNPAGLRREH
jgi:hypothetical protein